MLRKMIAHLVLLICFVSCVSGCGTTSVYVLDQAELIRVKADTTIDVKYDGWLLSDRAVKRVMDAKINGSDI